MKEENILIVGSGGQGIIFAGKLLSTAALIENRHVSWIPSYGIEVRGGVAHSMVTMSDDPILNPLVLHPDTLIALDQPSLQKFSHVLRPGGTVFMDATDITDTSSLSKDVKVYKIEAGRIAKKISSKKIKNVVMIGFYMSKNKGFKVKSGVDALKTFFPEGREDIFSQNKEALRAGYSFGGKR